MSLSYSTSRGNYSSTYSAINPICRGYALYEEPTLVKIDSSRVRAYSSQRDNFFLIFWMYNFIRINLFRWILSKPTARPLLFRELSFYFWIVFEYNLMTIVDVGMLLLFYKTMSLRNIFRQ